MTASFLSCLVFWAKTSGPRGVSQAMGWRLPVSVTEKWAHTSCGHMAFSSKNKYQGFRKCNIS